VAEAKEDGIREPTGWGAWSVRPGRIPDLHVNEQATG